MVLVVKVLKGATVAEAEPIVVTCAASVVAAVREALLAELDSVEAPRVLELLRDGVPEGDRGA